MYAKTYMSVINACCRIIVEGSWARRAAMEALLMITPYARTVAISVSQPEILGPGFRAPSGLGCREDLPKEFLPGL
jgi:hypothetical protein